MYFLAKALQIRSEQKNEIHWLSTELRQKTGTSHKPHFNLKDIKSGSKTINNTLHMEDKGVNEV